MDVLGVIAAYFIGSIPFALLLARRWGAGDLHRIGSGNIGAANVLRASGVKAGLLVAALDVGKGAAGVMVAGLVGGQGTVPALAGLAAVVGHIYPLWLRFRGGKGVATACGAFSVLAPMAALPVLTVFVTAVWWTKYVSAGSVLASLLLPPIALLTGSSLAVVLSSSAAAGLIVFRHRSNLMRIKLRQERRFGARA
ncbi:MAG: glycerol-3-phosphate 1-O-acyltransferase PlsY [Vicinamibacterales bacterium]